MEVIKRGGVWPRNQKRISLVPKITWRAGDHYRYAGAVTYERSVSTARSDAIPRLVQLLCGSTITRSVRDEELATWE